MKKLFLLFAAFACLNANAQKIESIEQDEFEGVVRIKTSVEKLSKETFKDTSGQTMFYIRTVDNGVFLHLLWQCRYPKVIAEGAKIYLLLDDKTKISGTCASDAYSEPGVASTKAVRVSGVLGLNIPYYLGLENAYSLIGKKVAKIRIFTSDSYKDFDVVEKNQDKIGNALELVIKELEKK